MTGATLDFIDRSMTPAIPTQASVDVDLNDFRFGARDQATPADLKLTAHVAGSVDEFIVTGPVEIAPTVQTAKLDIAGNGIRAGNLAAYLPPGLEVTLKDGRLKSHLDAELRTHPAGGLSGHLLVNGVDWRDGAEGATLFKVDAAALVVNRIDPENAIDVKEISVQGLETSAERAPSGSIRLLGIALGGPATEPATQPATTVATAATTQPGGAVASAAAPEPAAAPVTGIPAKRVTTFPLVTLDKLDINAKRITFTDLSRPTSAPLSIADLRLRNLNRIDWLGKDYDSKPATKLQLTCRVEPLIDTVTIDTQVTPFSRQPSLLVDLAVLGIHGDGLTALVPEIRDDIDGSGMADGTAKGSIELHILKLDRRSPLEFNLDRPLEAELGLKGMEFRQSKDGPLLAGLEEVHFDSMTVRGGTGDVRIKSLDVTKPAAHIVRDAEGVRAFGLLYKMPVAKAASTQPATTQPSSKPAPVQAVAAVVPPPKAAPTSRPSNEIRIDHLTVSGLDLLVEDRSVTPPLLMPINSLEVEARGASSLLPYDSDKKIRFNALVGSGKVPLAKHKKAEASPARSAACSGQRRSSRPCASWRSAICSRR